MDSAHGVASVSHDMDLKSFRLSSGAHGIVQADEDANLRKIGAMRRLPALALAFAVAAAPLAAGGLAAAKDHRDGGDRGDRGEQRGRGGDEGRWGGRGGPPAGWRGEGGHWGDRGGERSGERGGERGERYEPRFERGAPPPEAYAPPRRGGYLGPQGGAPIEDPGRYRLRPAPRGYMWVRVPGGMAIVSQATGQVFDVVPDRY
jgi:Ni/Co efflux regulator RcnB